MDDKENNISGTLEKVLYKNPDTGYLVGRLRLENQEQVTIVGNVFELRCGERLEVTGKWVFNKNYGKQFEIEKVNASVPTSLSGIENYLGSGLIRESGLLWHQRLYHVLNMIH